MRSPSVTRVFKGTVSIQSSGPRDKLSSKLSVVSTCVNAIVVGGSTVGTGFFLNGHIEVNRTAELTRRRESQHPPLHQASCETRSRRSRPTVCSTAFRLYRT